MIIDMKKILIHTFVFLLFVTLFASGASAQGGVDPNKTQIDIVPSAIGPVDASANDIVRFAINALIVIGVIASLLFLLWGGLRWILSGGDKGKVDAARSTIVAAIVGLVIVILAYVIVNTVLTIVTGSGLSGFNLPSLSDPEASKLPEK